METRNSATIVSDYKINPNWILGEEDGRRIVIKDRIRDACEKLISNGISYFYCGMSMGLDLLIGKVIMELHEQYPHIVLNCCIPYISQCKNWPDRERIQYNSLINSINAGVANVKILSNLRPERLPFKNLWIDWSYWRYNKFAIDNSDTAIVFVANEKSNCKAIKYVNKHSKIIFTIEIDI